MTPKLLLTSLSFFLITCVLCSGVYGQCPAGGIVLDTQAKVTDFSTDNPGCTDPPGGITILGATSTITDLSGLSVLTSIGGELFILATDVPNLSGLDNVASLGGELNITNNSSLNSVAALSSLTSINGDLTVSNNDALGSLTGLENINAATISSIVLTNNNILSICSITSTCTFISNGGTPTVSLNTFGCSNPTEVTNNCSFLPVTWLDIQVEDKASSAQLSWITATETNNRGFNIERSTHEDSWESLGFVGGAGNSTEPQFYQFEDMFPLPGYSYYRLRQVDFDGSTYYSPVVSIFRNGAGVLSLSPNPAKDLIQISGINTDSGRLRIFSATGALVQQSLWGGDRVDVSGLPKGVYLLILDQAGQTYRSKFVKQ